MLIAFLTMVNVFVWNTLINDLKLSEKRILIISDSHGAVVESLQVTTDVYETREEVGDNTDREATPPLTGESLTGEFSAYTSHVAQTDDSPCISADGTNICEYDGCVVASNDYEFGTIVEVEGFGECEVKDRMNSRYTGSGNMDIYFGLDYDEAVKFGRKQLSYIIK